MERKLIPKRTTKDASSTRTVPLYVQIGSDPTDAKVPAHHTSTSAPDVERNLTVLRTAIAHRESEALTPYKAQCWHNLLTQYDLLGKYPHIPHGIRYGFDAGIKPINRTYAPPNSPSLFQFPEAYKAIIEREFQSGRYIGPCSQQEVESFIGPFQSSPLALVPKPGKVGKYRGVHNFSFPHAPQNNLLSINYQIDPHQYPCTWGTFATVCNTIWHLPPNSQASVRDVAEAYRTVPLSPNQWPGLVVRLRDNDTFAINTNNNFGLASAGGVHGSIGDAGADLFRASGIGPLSKWVDDHIFFRIQCEYLLEYNEHRKEWSHHIAKHGGRLHSKSRYWYRGETMPNGQVMEFDEDAQFPLRDLSTTSPRNDMDHLYCYGDTDINRLSDALGIPWEHSKTVPFSSSIPYLGFTWNLQECTVEVPMQKRQKYLAAILEWKSQTKHVLEQVQKLYGKLLHTCLIIPMGRAYLTNLETMLGVSHQSPFMPRHPPRGTSEDLQWWEQTLRGSISRFIPGPESVLDIQAFSDASSAVGIGITIGGWWQAWRLLPGWKSDERDIGWAEAVGFEFLIRTIIILASSKPNTCYKLFGDNRGVVEGWWKGRSRNKPTNTIFRRIHDISRTSKCTFLSRYVPSKANPADKPSRGIYPTTGCILPEIPIPECLLPFVINFREELTESEINARKCGFIQSPLPKPPKDPCRLKREASFEHDEFEEEFLLHQQN